MVWALVGEAWVANTGDELAAIEPATLRARMAEMTMFLRVHMIPPWHLPRSADRGDGLSAKPGLLSRGELLSLYSVNTPRNKLTTHVLVGQFFHPRMRRKWGYIVR
jgi:hypothetical protein